MSNFARAVSLRAGGFLVLPGGFLIFASMKAKVAKAPRRVDLSRLT
jgi:hypothetical protein